MFIRPKENGNYNCQLKFSFVSQNPDSDEKRVLYTKSICEELMIGSETEEITEKLIMSIVYIMIFKKGVFCKW